jgi:alpha-beta hydrolase superfamily lysophospholipase
VLLLHGLGEHSGRYRHVAAALGDHEFSAFTFDLRGHGRSQGRRGDLDFFPRLLEDLLAIERVMEQELGRERPWFLLGHSMGGLIALRRIQTSAGPYRGAVLSAPWLATALPGPVCRLGVALGLVAPGLAIPSGLDASRLTRDSAMQAAWRADSLVHTRLTARLFRETVRAQGEAWAAAHRLSLPLLFLVPTDDPVVRSAQTVAFARGIVGGDVQVEILQGRRHEPFNDLGREAVFSILGEWLERQAGAAPRPGGEVP